MTLSIFSQALSPMGRPPQQKFTQATFAHPKDTFTRRADVLFSGASTQPPPPKADVKELVACWLWEYGGEDGKALLPEVIAKQLVERPALAREIAIKAREFWLLTALVKAMTKFRDDATAAGATPVFNDEEFTEIVLDGLQALVDAGKATKEGIVAELERRLAEHKGD